MLTAADGHTALELARAALPDLVVLDVMLPVLDGIEVCRQLRQFSDTYVIMLTARTEELDKILGLTVGADYYLTNLLVNALRYTPAPGRGDGERRESPGSLSDH